MIYKGFIVIYKGFIVIYKGFIVIYKGFIVIQWDINEIYRLVMTNITNLENPNHKWRF